MCRHVYREPKAVFSCTPVNMAELHVRLVSCSSVFPVKQPNQRQRLQRQLVDIASSFTAASTSTAEALQRGLSPLLLSSDGAISGLAHLLHSAGGFFGFLSEENNPGDIRPQLQSQALRLLRNHKVKRVQYVAAPSGDGRRGAAWSAAGRKGEKHRNNNKMKLITSYYTEEDFKCPICFELLLRPVVTPCLHIFCRDCMLAVLMRTSMCPLCRGPVYASQLESIEECSSEKVVDFALNVRPGLPLIWRQRRLGDSLLREPSRGCTSGTTTSSAAGPSRTLAPRVPVFIVHLS